MLYVISPLSFFNYFRTNKHQIHQFFRTQQRRNLKIFYRLWIMLLNNLCFSWFSSSTKLPENSEIMTTTINTSLPASKINLKKKNTKPIRLCSITYMMREREVRRERHEARRNLNLFDKKASEGTKKGLWKRKLPYLGAVAEIRISERRSVMGKPVCAEGNQPPNIATFHSLIVRRGTGSQPDFWTGFTYGRFSLVHWMNGNDF